MPQIGGFLPPRNQPAAAYLPFLIGKFLQNMNESRKADYDRTVMANLLAGQDPQQAIQEKPAEGLLNIIGRGIGNYGGAAGVSDLSPFTQQLLRAKAGPQFEDPIAREIRLAHLGGLRAGTEQTATQTEGLKENLAYQREARPLQIQNLKQQLENSRQEIEQIRLTNPDRARALKVSADKLEQEYEAEKEKRPFEIKRLDLDNQTAQEMLNQSKEISSLKKQYYQAQINEIQNAIETKKQLTPVQLEEMRATIGQIKANTGLLTAKDKATETGKALTSADLENATKIADNLVQGAYAGHKWGPNYTKAKLIMQYDKYKTLMQYPIKSQSERDAFDQIWNSRTQGDDFEAQVAGQTPGTQSKGTITQTATDPNTGEKIGWNGTQWIPLQ